MPTPAEWSPNEDTGTQDVPVTHRNKFNIIASLTQAEPGYFWKIFARNPFCGGNDGNGVAVADAERSQAKRGLLSKISR